MFGALVGVGQGVGVIVGAGAGNGNGDGVGEGNGVGVDGTGVGVDGTGLVGCGLGCVGGPGGWVGPGGVPLQLTKLIPSPTTQTKTNIRHGPLPRFRSSTMLTGINSHNPGYRSELRLKITG